LSDAFELVKSTASKGYYINGVWDIGDLDVGERANLEIISKVVKTVDIENGKMIVELLRGMEDEV